MPSVLRGKQELAAGGLVVDFDQWRHNPPRVQKEGNNTVVLMRSAAVYLVDARVGPAQVVLPRGLVTGAPLTIKKIDSTNNAVTIRPSEGSIEGQEKLTLTAPMQTYTLITDGKNWYAI